MQWARYFRGHGRHPYEANAYIYRSGIHDAWVWYIETKWERRTSLPVRSLKKAKAAADNLALTVAKLRPSRIRGETGWVCTHYALEQQRGRFV